MRHRKNSSKLGRTSAHRQATISSLVCSLIVHKRIRTTVPKAKQARSLAEKMVTLARRHDRETDRTAWVADIRQAASVLRQKNAVSALFDEVAPKFAGRSGGYTRIVKIGQRVGDGAEVAVLEWIDTAAPAATKPKKQKEEAESDNS